MFKLKEASPKHTKQWSENDKDWMDYVETPPLFQQICQLIAFGQLAGSK